MTTGLLSIYLNYFAWWLRYRLGDRGTVVQFPMLLEISLFSKASRPAGCYLMCISPGVKWLVRRSDSMLILRLYRGVPAQCEDAVKSVVKNHAIERTRFISRLYVQLKCILHRMICNTDWMIFSHGSTAPLDLGLLYEVPRSHRLTTFGRSPLDEWSSHRRDLYRTTHNNHKRQTSVRSAGFEPAIPASERLQIHSLDRRATVIGTSVD